MVVAEERIGKWANVDDVNNRLARKADRIKKAYSYEPLPQILVDF